MIFLILVAIILPMAYITTKLVREARGAVSLVTESPARDIYLERVERWIERVTGEAPDLHAYKDRLLSEVRSFLLKAIPNVLGSITDWLLGFSSCFS